MNKRALLIGNNNGLPGVQVDFTNYSRYLKSAKGGSWLDSEIIKEMNPDKVSLLIRIQRLKDMKLDFVIVIYSGHGGQERETVFEINKKGETIGESDISNIAPRQINIIDCCRSRGELLTDSYMSRGLSVYSDFKSKYDNRIMQAIPQQVKLYACRIGEVANDTIDGGAYSKSLIDSAISDSSEYVLVGEVHQKAAELTTKKFPDQHPESVLPRCLSNQQLIFGIK